MRWKTLVVPLGLICICLAARLIPGPRTVDDAYITFRYARNIVSGAGFVFNTGEPVLGTTTPLFTLILTFLSLLTGGSSTDFPLLSWIINALFDALAVLLLCRIGDHLGYSGAGMSAALLWCIAPFSVTFSIGGLETSLFIALSLLVIFTFLIGRFTLFGISSALLLLTRPDGLILLGPLWLIILFRLKASGGWRMWLCFLIPVFTWLIFAWIYFGNPIPHSILAKSVAYNMQPAEAFIRLLQHYATPFLEQETLPSSWLIAGLILYPLLALIGALVITRHNQSRWGVVIYPLLYFLLYSIANPLLFRWYLSPPLPVYILLIAIGVSFLFSRFIRWATDDISKQRVLYKTITILLLLVPVIFTLNAWTLNPDHASKHPAPKMAWIKIEQAYRQAADWLIMDSKGTYPLMASADVGVIGYYSDFPILDLVGLNSPVSSGYYPLTQESYILNYAIPVQLIMDTRPLYVVFVEAYGKNTLLRDGGFLKSYHQAAAIPIDFYSSSAILIYKNND